MSGWSIEKTKRNPSRLKPILNRILYWMDERGWNWPGTKKGKLYKWAWRLHAKRDWHGGRCHWVPPIPIA